MEQRNIFIWPIISINYIVIQEITFFCPNIKITNSACPFFFLFSSWIDDLKQKYVMQKVLLNSVKKSLHEKNAWFSSKLIV